MYSAYNKILFDGMGFDLRYSENGSGIGSWRYNVKVRIVFGTLAKVGVGGVRSKQNVPGEHRLEGPRMAEFLSLPHSQRWRLSSTRFLVRSIGSFSRIFQKYTINVPDD
jgi:hypothetical protein